MQLMQEGVQKTASYCASICAERVVSARREMQRRWAEERRELERIYGLAPGSGAGSGFGTPSSARMNHVPRAVASRAGSCNSWSTPCQELPASSPQNEGAAPRALSSSKVEDDSGQQNLDSSFIDAYDAVQTLEERNHQAARAMQLLDEALKAAETAGCGNHSHSGQHPMDVRPSPMDPVRSPLANVSPVPHRAPQAPWSLNGAGQRHKGPCTRSNSAVVTQFPASASCPCPAPPGAGRSCSHSSAGDLREPSTMQGSKGSAIVLRTSCGVMKKSSGAGWSYDWSFLALHPSLIGDSLLKTAEPNCFSEVVVSL